MSNNPARETSEARRLLVVTAAPLSAILAKGEVIPRYYNPGDVFDEVHLLFLNNDKVSTAELQSMCGRAKVSIHQAPPPPRYYIASLGLRPWLLRRLLGGAIELGGLLRPTVVRAHGLDVAAFVAAGIKKRFKTPFLLSLHGNPDVDYFRGRKATSVRRFILGQALRRLERTSLVTADLVIAVYTPILPYLRRHRVTNYEVIYNVVALDRPVKRDYSFRDPARVHVTCVSRQTHLEKDPTCIIEAVEDLPQIHLTLVGDGDLHDQLVARVASSNAADRIEIIRALPNHNILELLGQTDIYAYNSENYEISKTCMEASLIGLPIVLNDREGRPAQEIVGGHMHLVPASKEGFKEGLLALVQDDHYREELGRRARRFAENHWEPRAMEAKQADAYVSLIGAHG